ncbi:MAG: hypothetical protein J6D13_04440 [Clostridium sp.]|nr:hypothetical protein [Clostridium sp.]
MAASKKTVTKAPAQEEVKAPAAEVKAAAPAAEVQAPEVKKEAPKKATTAKKAAEPKKAPARRTAAKKAAEVETSVYVQYAGREVTVKELVAEAKSAYIAAGHKEEDIKTIDVYVKPEENAAYYVVNGSDGNKIEL